MGRKEKLIQKLKRQPRDFTWQELESLLGYLGYAQVSTGKTGGSRRRFIHETAAPIILHKPHPHNTLRHYQVKQVLETLENGELI